MSADDLSDLVRFHLDPATAPALSGNVLPALVDVFREQVAASTSEPVEPLHLLLEAARRQREPARAAFRAESRSLVGQARALLEADRRNRPGSRDAGAVGGAIGELGASLIDPSALAETLDARPTGTALTAARRERLGAALEELEAFLAAPEAPPLILVHDGSHPIPEGEANNDDAQPPPWRVDVREDPCAGTAVIFDREAEGLSRVLRAARRIRLEAAGSYEPERHDPWLDRFDWQAFSRDELLLLPPLAALATADQIAHSQMAALSSLLSSGRPVQVLVAVEPARDPGADLGADPFAGYRFELAYLGLSHREALVHQTSRARPDHMEEAFSRSLAAARASLHVIASGSAPSPLGAELTAAMAVAGRAHPLFHYDPEAGASWAERLDFADNPSPGDDWPEYPLAASPDSGDEPLDLAFTFADFALLEPGYARHFRPVPDDTADDRIVPLARWVKLPELDATTPIPFIWADDGASRRVRLAVSRSLALACRDRLGFWSTLQELSGARSVYAQRAGEKARLEAEERARQEIEGLRSEHAEALERLREESTREVVDRLTAALLEVDLTTLGGPAEPPVATSPLHGLGGSSVDEVAAALLAIVQADGSAG